MGSPRNWVKVNAGNSSWGVGAIYKSRLVARERCLGIARFWHSIVAGTKAGKVRPHSGWGDLPCSAH